MGPALTGMRDLVFIGAAAIVNEMSETVDAINELQPTFRILGIIDDDPSKAGTEVAGITVLGGEDALGNLDLSNTEFLIAFNSPSNYLKRKDWVENAPSELLYATVIHPSARISPTANIGHGVYIGSGVVLDAKSKVGDHTIVLFNSVISRFVELGKFGFVSASVNVTGHRKIGESVYLGVKSTIDGNIADSVLVSAASIVKRNIEEGYAIISSEVNLSRIECKDSRRMKKMLGSLR